MKQPDRFDSLLLLIRGQLDDLASCGCCLIVGHRERRTYHLEVKQIIKITVDFADVRVANERLDF
jgi:hypothetical protein